MTINLNWVGHHSAALDSALEAFNAGKAKLLDEHGERIYSDAEHERRVAALATTLVTAADAAIAEADRAEAEAQRAQALTSRDPLDSLSAAEVARANERRAFVSEDAARLPLDELTKRVEIAGAGADKAAHYLWARYGRRRVDAENDTGVTRDSEGVAYRRPARDPHAVRLLDEAVRALEARLADPKVAERAAGAERMAVEALRLRIKAGQVKREADGSAAAAREEMRRRYAMAF